MAGRFVTLLDSEFTRTLDFVFEIYSLDEPVDFCNRPPWGLQSVLPFIVCGIGTGEPISQATLHPTDTSLDLNQVAATFSPRELLFRGGGHAMRMRPNVLAAASASFLVLMGGCNWVSGGGTPRLPLLPSPSAPTSKPLPDKIAALAGNWSGTMNDWVGNAAAVVMLSATKYSLDGQMTYTYNKPADANGRSYDSHGTISLGVGDGSGTTVTISFRGSGSPSDPSALCWNGTFTAAVVGEGCTSALSGDYHLAGATEECFSPGRIGTFKFVRAGCH